MTPKEANEIWKFTEFLFSPLKVAIYLILIPIGIFIWLVNNRDFFSSNPLVILERWFRK